MRDKSEEMEEIKEKLKASQVPEPLSPPSPRYLDNYVDIYMSVGLRYPNRPLSLVPGTEGAGPSLVLLDTHTTLPVQSL